MAWDQTSIISQEYRQVMPLDINNKLNWYGLFFRHTSFYKGVILQLHLNDVLTS